MSSRTLIPTHIDHPAVGHELAMAWAKALAHADDGEQFIAGASEGSIPHAYAVGIAARMLEIDGLPRVRPDQGFVVVGAEFYTHIRLLSSEFPSIAKAAHRILPLEPLAYNLRFLPCSENAAHIIRRQIEVAVMRSFDSAWPKAGETTALAGLARLLTTASEISEVDALARVFVFEREMGQRRKAKRIREQFVAFTPGQDRAFETRVEDLTARRHGAVKSIASSVARGLSETPRHAEKRLGMWSEAGARFMAVKPTIESAAVSLERVLRRLVVDTPGASRVLVERSLDGGFRIVTSKGDGIVTIAHAADALQEVDTDQVSHAALIIDNQPFNKWATHVRYSNPLRSVGTSANGVAYVVVKSTSHHTAKTSQERSETHG
jgi:hypothetical protein